MAKKLSFSVKILRPVCRTPIKPVEKHKIATKYVRKTKYPNRELSYE